jgi:NAD(P)-dependent dehydrogenase (short-subunit alcohol dehydrogenase family)
MSLNGRRAIISGASQGLGLAIAKAYVSEGASVAICGRNNDTLMLAQQELVALAKDSNQVLAVKADISKPDEMNHLVEETLKKFGGIDILVSNAGIYGPKGSIDTIDWDEWCDAIDINIKGSVFLCRAVLPHLKQKNYGKIIFLSGGGATKPMPNLSAYATSKAAIVRFAETLAGEVKDFNIDVNSIAPGALNTRLLDEILEAGPEKVGEAFYKQSIKQKETGGASLELGSSLCVYLASPASDGITGKLLSAVWDPWESLAKYENDLKDTDVYTLRRIIPKERGYAWGEKE